MKKSVAVISALGVFFLASCSETEPTSGADDAAQVSEAAPSDSPSSTPSDTAGPPKATESAKAEPSRKTSAEPGVVYGDCSIEVGGKVYLDIKKTCRIDMQEDGSFQVNLNSDTPTYFAYVSILDDGFANVSWNGTEKASHAQELLGEDFRRKGACWIGAKGKVCATKR